MFIDTHTHLYVEEFDEDRKAVMDRARQKGVYRYFIPAINASYIKKMKALKEEYPDEVYLMAGLHPCYVKDDFKEELNQVYEQIISKEIVAIGEIGIDLFWDKSTFAIQKEAFITQLHWAKEFNLPIVIHARDSLNEIYEILEKQNITGLKGIFHCFTGDFNQAKRAIEFGFLLGIGGVATFKNGKIDQYLAQIDLANIVLETDAPYLAPVPYRGKRNESAYIYEIAARLATIYGISIEEIASITSKNANQLFFDNHTL